MGVGRFVVVFNHKASHIDPYRDILGILRQIEGYWPILGYIGGYWDIYGAF